LERSASSARSLLRLLVFFFFFGGGDGVALASVGDGGEMCNDRQHVVRQLGLWGVISRMEHGEGRTTRCEYAVKQVASKPGQAVSMGNHNAAHAAGEHFVHQSSKPAAAEVEAGGDVGQEKGFWGGGPSRVLRFLLETLTLGGEGRGLVRGGHARIKNVEILGWVGCGVGRGQGCLKSRVWDGQGGGVSVEVVLAMSTWGSSVGELSSVGPVDERRARHPKDALRKLSSDPAIIGH